jgi:hypothetical protein
MEAKNEKFKSELEEVLSSDELTALKAGLKAEILGKTLATADSDGAALICCIKPEED